MPRIARMVINGEGEEAVYHCMSRTALNFFLFGNAEKEYMVELLRQLNRLYFVELNRALHFRLSFPYIGSCFAWKPVF